MPMTHCLHVLTNDHQQTSFYLQEQRERARQRASRFGTTDTLDAKVESLRQAQGERQRKRDRAERFNMEVEAEDETGQEDAGLLSMHVMQGDHGVEGRGSAASCAAAIWILGVASRGAGEGRYKSAQHGGRGTASHRGKHMSAVSA